MALVNVKFQCEACRCEVVVEARVSGKDTARLYEYTSNGDCPNCPHRLLARHRPCGEVWSGAAAAAMTTG